MKNRTFWIFTLNCLFQALLNTPKAFSQSTVTPPKAIDFYKTVHLHHQKNDFLEVLAAQWHPSQVGSLKVAEAALSDNIMWVFQNRSFGRFGIPLERKIPDGLTDKISNAHFRQSLDDAFYKLSQACSSFAGCNIWYLRLAIAANPSDSSPAFVAHREALANAYEEKNLFSLALFEALKSYELYNQTNWYPADDPKIKKIRIKLAQAHVLQLLFAIQEPTFPFLDTDPSALGSWFLSEKFNQVFHPAAENREPYIVWSKDSWRRLGERMQVDELALQQRFGF